MPFSSIIHSEWILILALTVCCTERIKRIGDGKEYVYRIPTKKRTDADPCLFGMYLAVKWNSVFDKQLGCATAIYSLHIVGLQNQSKHPQIRRIQELKKCWLLNTWQQSKHTIPDCVEYISDCNIQLMRQAYSFVNFRSYWR